MVEAVPTREHGKRHHGDSSMPDRKISEVALFNRRTRILIRQLRVLQYAGQSHVAEIVMLSCAEASGYADQTAFFTQMLRNTSA